MKVTEEAMTCAKAKWDTRAGRLAIRVALVLETLRPVAHLRSPFLSVTWSWVW